MYCQKSSVSLTPSSPSKSVEKRAEKEREWRKLPLPAITLTIYVQIVMVLHFLEGGREKEGSNGCLRARSASVVLR